MRWEKPAMSSLDEVGPCHPCAPPLLYDPECKEARMDPCIPLLPD